MAMTLSFILATRAVVTFEVYLGPSHETDEIVNRAAVVSTAACMIDWEGAADTRDGNPHRESGHE